MLNQTKKEIVTDFLKRVVANDIREAYDKYVSNTMKHHNIWFKGDRESLVSAMEENAKSSPVKFIDIKLVLEDGDYVSSHSHVKQSTEDIGVSVVHIFRFESEKIAEMWDVIMPIPADSPNENGAF